MIFYRSAGRGKPIPLGIARVVTSASLVLYPAGALLLAFSDAAAPRIAGYGLIFLSLVCAGIMVGSPLQRIVGDTPDRLDEYELKLRNRAVGAGYTCLSVLVLLAIIYAAFASDRGAWVPSSYEEYNGLFWGAFLYASLLPSLFLVWQIDRSDADDAGVEP